MIREKTIGIEQVILIDYLGEDEFYKLSFSKINKILNEKLITFVNVGEVVDYFFDILKTHRGFKKLSAKQMVEKIYHLKNKALSEIIKLLEKAGVILIKGIGDEPLFFGYQVINKKSKGIK